MPSSLTLQPALLESSAIQRAVLETLIYSDIFDFSLRLDEIHRYLPLRADREELRLELETLNERVGMKDGDYFLPGRDEIVAIRAGREARARSLLPRAVRYSRLLASLPFVHMVAITGSLAMGSLEEGKDIDYMIVTAPSHLWTCRALTLLVTRIARFEGISLCPNYLVSENALELTDHSFYTAHELTQMIPISGMEIYDEMRRLNMWTDEYLPNAQGAPKSFVAMKEPSRLQPLLEFVFKILPFQWFEKWEMNRKIKKLSREQSSSSESRFSKDVCKGHADRHGEKIEHAFRERLQDFEPADLINAAHVDIS